MGGAIVALEQTNATRVQFALYARGDALFFSIVHLHCLLHVPCQGILVPRVPVTLRGSLFKD